MFLLLIVKFRFIENLKNKLIFNYVHNHINIPVTNYISRKIPSNAVNDEFISLYCAICI